MAMLKWLTRDSSKPEIEPLPERMPERNETAVLIGEAVAEIIPQSMIADDSVFEIDVLISNGDEVMDLHLKMRIDSGLCVQMMEYPIDAKS